MEDNAAPPNCLKAHPTPKNTKREPKSSIPMDKVIDLEAASESIDDSQHQIESYDPTSVVNEEPHEPNEPIPLVHPFSDTTPRILPGVGAFTVQCADCFKWRLIPTREKYQEIREHILERPFVCQTAQEWRSGLSCDDPTDLTQDDSMVWAIDKPSIARPPLGWQRQLRIRGEGSYKFADVYYIAPTGKVLRSLVEIERYLGKHPSYKEGISMSQFSFKAPRPLQENYVRKRPAVRPKEAPRRDSVNESGSSVTFLQLKSSNAEDSLGSTQKPTKMGKSD